MDKEMCIENYQKSEIKEAEITENFEKLQNYHLKWARCCNLF